MTVTKSKVIYLTNSSFKSVKIEVPSDMRDCWLGSTKGSLGFCKKKVGKYRWCDVKHSNVLFFKNSCCYTNVCKCYVYASHSFQGALQLHGELFQKQSFKAY